MAENYDGPYWTRVGGEEEQWRDYDPRYGWTDEDSRRKAHDTGCEWYWSGDRRCHVAARDGETTTKDLAEHIAEGGDGGYLEADYWVMAGHALVAETTGRLHAADTAATASATVDNLAEVGAAERAHSEVAATSALLEVLGHEANVAAAEAHDDRVAELVERNNEVNRVYDLIFDREHYASFCEGDGAAEDNYSDQTWQAAETLVDGGRTAQSIKASREAAASAYPEPTPDDGKGDNELWARLNTAPSQVQDEFWLVHPRPGDPDITEAMLADAYAAVGIRGEDTTAADFIAQSRNPEDVADDDGSRAGTSNTPAVEPAAPHARDVAAGTPANDVLAELTADRAQLATGEAEDLANAERAQAAWEHEGDQRSLWEELGASPPEVRAAFWGARDAAGHHAGHAMSPAELGAAYEGAGLPIPEDLQHVAAEESDTAADRGAVAEVEGSGVDVAAEVVQALPGSWDAAVPGVRAGQSADSVLAAVLDELDQARARLEAGDVPAEREHEQAEYIEHLEDQAKHAAGVTAGKSADDVLTELIADLDATPPDPYPGDEAYRAHGERSAAMSPAEQLETLHGRDLAAAQILHDALYYDGPPVPAEQAADFAAYAEMWAQEALADYDRDLAERTEVDQSAQGRTHGYPAAEGRSPGDPRCAEAVAAAHAAVRADAQRVTEELEQEQPAQAHGDGQQHSTVADQQSATHEGGEGHE